VAKPLNVIDIVVPPEKTPFLLRMKVFFHPSYSGLNAPHDNQGVEQF
jgi:hypothetical protein